MIRQPPAYVPAAIESAAARMTHVGGRVKSALRSPAVTSARAMIPIVFWASFVPCVNATKPPEKSWSFLKARPTFAGERRLIVQTISVIKMNAIARPAKGAISEGFSTLCQRPDHWITFHPCAMIAEPITPPISA